MMYNHSGHKVLIEGLQRALGGYTSDGAGHRKITDVIAFLNDPAMQFLLRWFHRQQRPSKLRQIETALRTQVGNSRLTAYMTATDEGQISVHKYIRCAPIELPESAGPMQLYDYFLPTWKLIVSERAIPELAQGWSTSKRTIKRLMRNEVTSVEKMLMNFTNLPALYHESGIGEVGTRDRIARHAVNIKDDLRPMTLQFATTPEGILDVYEGGLSSCMVTSGREAAWVWMTKKHKVGPTGFFAYTGKSKCAYIKRGGTILGRAICYQQKDDSWKYGRIYMANSSWGTRFTALLQEAGLRPLDNNNQCWDHEFTWRAPAFLYNGDKLYYTPLPYFDNFQGGRLHVKFVAPTEGQEPYFEFTAMAKKSNVGLTQTVGLLNQTGTLTCAHCSRQLQGHSPIFPQDGSGAFCNDSCANQEGYYRCSRSDGAPVWLQKAQAFITVDNQYFTNRDAAVKRGAHPVLSEPDAEPEDDDLLGCDSLIRIGERTFSVYQPSAGLNTWLKLKPKNMSTLKIIATKVQRNVDPEITKLIELNRPLDFPQELIDEFVAKFTDQYNFNPRAIQIVLIGGVMSTDRYINTSHYQGIEL
jgi:hypothetical protein